MRACKNCRMITEWDVCPVCKTNTSQYWSGYLGVIDPEKSEIARRIGIKVRGQYAMKVR